MNGIFFMLSGVVVVRANVLWRAVGPHRMMVAMNAAPDFFRTGEKTSAPIRALIVDDDALARTRLRMLAGLEDDIEIVGECADGREAVDVLTASDVDLVFLDVEMPRLDGFGVIAEVGAERMPPVIFTSAYSQFAVRAFEAYALDYLLKPFDATRFSAAVARAGTQVESARGRRSTPTHLDAALNARLLGLIEHIQRPHAPEFPDALAIRSGGQYAVVRVTDIDWIEADGNYAKVYVNQKPRLLAKSLATLETEVLDPAVFVRVHRSAIVNTTKIVGLEPMFHGELSLILRDGARVKCSRRFRKHLEAKLYFTT